MHRREPGARRDANGHKGEGKERDKTTYTAEEMEGALSAVKGTAAYIPAILCGLGSCRVGEALGVRCDEVEGGGQRDDRGRRANLASGR